MLRYRCCCSFFHLLKTIYKMEWNSMNRMFGMTRLKWRRNGEQHRSHFIIESGQKSKHKLYTCACKCAFTPFECLGSSKYMRSTLGLRLVDRERERERKNQIHLISECSKSKASLFPHIKYIQITQQHIPYDFFSHIPSQLHISRPKFTKKFYWLTD